MVKNPLLDAALDYARLGWRVVWLHHPKAGGGCTCGKDCGTSAGKHPRLPKWTQSATTDEEQIARWWHDAPASNVGVALGSGSGIVAVDVDPPHGEEFLQQISGGDLPDTLTLTTGKGRSLLYAIPEGLEVEPKTVGWKDADGQETIRLQSTGAQRVMPPSLHLSGRRYAWVAGRGPGEIELAPMPAWMVVEMTVPKEARWADPTVHGPSDAYAPGAEWNRRGSWVELLTNHGFKPAGGRGDVLYFTRPGKSAGVSVTVGHFKAKDGTPALYVFSGSIPDLAATKCYDLFGAYARLDHKGDFSAAAKALAAMGYGTPTPPKRKRSIEEQLSDLKRENWEMARELAEQRKRLERLERSDEARNDRRSSTSVTQWGGESRAAG